MVADGAGELVRGRLFSDRRQPGTVINQSLTRRGCSWRRVRVNTSTCSPDTRPASSDTPIAGICSVVSARRNSSSPRRKLVRADSANDFSGNDDNPAINLANATWRPSTHDCNRRKSPDRSLDHTDIRTTSIDRRHPPDKALNVRQLHPPLYPKGCDTVTRAATRGAYDQTVTVDLFADDVGVTGVAGGLPMTASIAHRRSRIFPVAGHRCICVADRSDDLIACLAARTRYSARSAAARPRDRPASTGCLGRAVPPATISSNHFDSTNVRCCIARPGWCRTTVLRRRPPR